MIIVYSPFPDQQSATTVARFLIEEKIAACCQIIPGITSLFFWEDAIQSTQECILWCKSINENQAKLETAIAERHPYETPCILSWSAQANPDFSQWLKTVL